MVSISGSANQRNWQAVVLAGGLATRMRPRTQHVPKLLLNVGGKPFAEHLIKQLKRCGASEVVLCIGHLGQAIRDALGNGNRFGVHILYSDEGDTLLGTGGAVKHAAPLIRDTFVLTYGDSFLPFDYHAPLEDLEAHPNALGTMAVYKNADTLDVSNCVVLGTFVVRYEKRLKGSPRDPQMDHIDYGATALRKQVIDELPSGVHIDFADVQSRLAQAGRLRAYTSADRFYEIGSEAGLADFEAFVQSQRGPK
ncbi:MAG: NTP transferase domain-containing protein [Polyangiaceae bacterium]|nr:NTP transferase domain-containing protein [Polyangiaceae bacterium]